MKKSWIGFILFMAILAATFTAAIAQQPTASRVIEIAGQRINLDELPPVESTTNDQGRPEALKVPAVHKSLVVCSHVGEQLGCSEFQALECPSTILYVDTDGNRWTCDLECEGGLRGARPGPDGNCDCTVLLNTCRR